MRNNWCRAGTGAALAMLLCGGAWADHGGGDRHHEENHRHVDVHQFRGHEYPHWHEGHWYHGDHGGRLGWWWAVGGLWYFYPAPVYPYPDPYAPPAVIYQPQDPAAVYQEQGPTPEDQAAPDSPPPAQNWYYCNSSKTYYPYVSSCPEGWQTVPATPAEDGNP